jgi:hypothetical protein
MAGPGSLASTSEKGQEAGSGGAVTEAGCHCLMTGSFCNSINKNLNGQLFFKFDDSKLKCRKKKKEIKTAKI